MGMDLLHGGHLTHGSPVNRSGKYYNAVHYSVDPDTEQINYDAVEELARQHKPRFIIAGYSSYPWAADWNVSVRLLMRLGPTFLPTLPISLVWWLQEHTLHRRLRRCGNFHHA